MNASLTLSNLKPGDHVRLVAFGATDLDYYQQLLKIGLNIGLEVEILNVAPLGCPVQIMIRGRGLALRKHDAKYLQWEYVNC